MPMVSVVMPAYNSGRFIGESIRSVAGQTFSDWELIIVDDCSSDDTLAVAEYASGCDPRIKILRNGGRMGPAASRNRAVEAASGRFIAFLDSDDLWLPLKLEKQLGFMESGGYALTYASYRKIDEDGNYLGMPLVFPGSTDYKGLLRTNIIGCLTAMYDTKPMGKVYMPLILKRQDYGLWLKITSLGYAAHGMGECLALYRVRHSSVSNNKLLAAAYTWRIYRQVEGRSLLESAVYFIQYAFHGTLKWMR